MCLILFSYKQHPVYPLILAANRDEFLERPTAPADFWPDAPTVLAGRDLVGGGSWLGVTRGGRLAALSNYRDFSRREKGERSRGLLVSDFLRGEKGPAAYLEQVAQERGSYKSFNLLVGDRLELYCYSSRRDGIRRLTPGLYGLSNHLLDTPWPKVERGKEALAALLAQGGNPHPEDLFALMADTARPDDALLPDTGIGLEWERILSSPFIVSPRYGTRSSTVVLFGGDGAGTFIERTFRGDPRQWSEVRHAFPRER
jgi:uncharacterized protein with NRDE domain